MHVVTKKTFAPVLENNPYIDKVFTFDKEITEIITELDKENYDHLIDLHNNLRSRRLKLLLNQKSSTFKKLNIEKWLAVNFKKKEILPNMHIVQRYLQAAEELGVKDDGEGLDYFIGEKDKVNLDSISPGLGKGFMALVVGGSYHTKKIPVSKLIEICNASQLPVVLMGGKEDKTIAQLVVSETKNSFNVCGLFSINQSASIIKQSSLVVTSDTGLMHIAAAFHKIIYSVWGNTIPEFGMYPYKPDPKSKILQVQGLSCRPCSKLGYDKCPKGHFKCMNEIEVSGMGF